MQFPQCIDRARSPGGGGARNDLEFGDSRQPLLDKDAKLDTRQIGAETGMCTTAEADVMHAATVKAYLLRVGETLWIEVVQRT